MNGFFIILIIYLFCHLPAIILMVLGLIWRKSKPRTAKVLLIIAGIYFIVGGGICGTILTGI